MTDAKKPAAEADTTAKPDGAAAPVNEAGPAPGHDPFGEQRDHIAIALAVGILSGSPAYINRGSDLAAAAYGLADTMIEHRRKANG